MIINQPIKKNYVFKSISNNKKEPSKVPEPVIQDEPFTLRHSYADSIPGVDQSTVPRSCYLVYSNVWHYRVSFKGTPEAEFPEM
jgi:hypothetical protein